MKNPIMHSVEISKTLICASCSIASSAPTPSAASKILCLISCKVSLMSSPSLLLTTQMLLMYSCHLSSTLSTFLLPKHGGSQALSGCLLLEAYWWVANERPIKGKSIDPHGAWWRYHCNRNTIGKDMRCQASEEQGWNNHFIYCSAFGLSLFNF